MIERVRNFLPSWPGVALILAGAVLLPLLLPHWLAGTLWTIWFVALLWSVWPRRASH